MSEVKILTKEIAEQFIADEESVDLSKFTKMDKGGYTAVVEHLLPRIQFRYDVDDGISVDEKLLAELRSKLIENLPDEFIVKHRHYHCEMEIEGYEIMNPEYFKKLQEALKSEESVSLPNTPGHWESELPISDLANAFQIISVSQEDVDAFRKLYQKNSIGITDLSLFLVEEENEDEEWFSIDDEDEEGELELEGITELSDAAAESLSKHKGELNLNGLTELSEAAAKSLSKHYGELNLDGLTELSDSVAQSLSKHKGCLSLNGLTELSDAAAKNLSKHKGGSLNLDGLTELSDAAAKSLSKHKGTSLSLSGLTELSEAALKFFVRKFDHFLVSAEMQGKISKNMSTHLQRQETVRKETELSDDALENLLKFKGDLHLDKITKLSNSVAEKLSKFKGSLSLSRVYEIDSKIARFLGSHSGDFLSVGLLELTDPLVAQELAKYKGCLDLPKIQSISDEAADELTKFKGKMFRSMSPFEISDVAAKSLSKIEDKLSLNLVPKEKIDKVLYG
jgi:hypothetical protein